MRPRPAQRVEREGVRTEPLSGTEVSLQGWFSGTELGPTALSGVELNFTGLKETQMKSGELNLIDTSKINTHILQINGLELNLQINGLERNPNPLKATWCIPTCNAGLLFSAQPKKLRPSRASAPEMSPLHCRDPG